MTAYERLSWGGPVKEVEHAQRRELGLPEATSPWPQRIAERGSLEIQAYDEVCFPGLATEWAKWGGQRPFVGALTMESSMDADDEVASWIAAGTPPIFFGFGGIPVESPADTLAMIAGACAQVGERALVCAGWSDFSDVPHFAQVKVVGAVNFAAIFPACRAIVHHSGAGTTRPGPACRSPPVDALDVARSVATGSCDQTTEGRHRTALFDHHREIAGRGPSPDSRPAICHSGPRARLPDHQIR